MKSFTDAQLAFIKSNPCGMVILTENLIATVDRIRAEHAAEMAALKSDLDGARYLAENPARALREAWLSPKNLPTDPAELFGVLNLKIETLEAQCAKISSDNQNNLAESNVPLPSTISDAIKAKVLHWFIHGHTGSSSECMASYLIFGKADGDVPWDSSDFNRCLLLLEAVPELRPLIPRMAALNSVWAALVARWDEIEKTFLDEAGLDWSKSDEDSKTNALLREIQN